MLYKSTDRFAVRHPYQFREINPVLRTAKIMRPTAKPFNGQWLFFHPQKPP
jgi:hypothetical protein